MCMCGNDCEKIVTEFAIHASVVGGVMMAELSGDKVSPRVVLDALRGLVEQLEARVNAQPKGLVVSKNLFDDVTALLEEADNILFAEMRRQGWHQ